MADVHTLPVAGTTTTGDVVNQLNQPIPGYGNIYSDPVYDLYWQQAYAYLAQNEAQYPVLGQWLQLFRTDRSQALGNPGFTLLQSDPAVITLFQNAWTQVKADPRYQQLASQYPDQTNWLGTWFDTLLNPTATTPASGDLTDIQKSARASLNATLSQFGLDTLGTFVWNEYLNGIPIEQIMLDIRGTPEYQARFPAMKALADKGHAMSEASYIAYEKQVTSIMRAAGMPEGMFDQPDDFKGFLENELSAQEVGQRVQDWLNFASTAPTINQAELQQFYGVDASGIAAYFLDPDRALPLLEKQANSALIGVHSIQGGYGQLSRQQAEYVAGLGIQPQQTLKGFQQLVQEQQLFNPLPGQVGPSFNQDQQLQATFGGNQQAITALENVARQRVATNEGDYQYLADQKTSGVGGAEKT